MDYIFQLLTTLLALNGNQVMELDYQTQLGRDTHTELAGYRSIEPYQNVNQIRNYAILCALLGWDATAVMPQTPQLHFLRHFGEQYSVAQASANQIKFLEYYVDNWNTNWLAGQVEANILKRLAIQSSTKAPVFLE